MPMYDLSNEPMIVVDDLGNFEIVLNKDDNRVYVVNTWGEDLCFVETADGRELLNAPIYRNAIVFAHLNSLKRSRKIAAALAEALGAKFS